MGRFVEEENGDAVREAKVLHGCALAGCTDMRFVNFHYVVFRKFMKKQCCRLWFEEVCDENKKFWNWYLFEFVWDFLSGGMFWEFAAAGVADGDGV